MIQISRPILTEKDIDDVVEVLKSGMIVQGPKVKILEENFAQYCGAKYAVAFNSGTASLHAALYALGIREGDEVITTPFTFVATANSILMQNANVKFVDIDEDTFCISPIEVEKNIGEKTKAVLPVSLYGMPYDQSINEVAHKRGVKVIDDAAQSVGAMVGKKKAGTFADISSFSLYATKNLMAGEGGMVTTDDPEYAELCKRFRHHGQSEQTRYQYFDLGYNYRMTDIHAAIGINQLVKIEDFTAKRIENARYLSEGLGEVKGVIAPAVPDNVRHVFHQYTIRVQDDYGMGRDELKALLEQNGVGSAVYYPKALHLCPQFQKFGYREGDFPVAEKMTREVLSLPVHPHLSKDDLGKIISVIRNK